MDIIFFFILQDFVEATLSHSVMSRQYMYCQFMILSCGLNEKFQMYGGVLSLD